MTKDHIIPVSLSPSRHYNIHVDDAIFNRIHSTAMSLNLGNRFGIFCTHQTADYANEIAAQLTKHEHRVFIYQINDGETEKCWDTAKLLLDNVFDWHLERRDTLIAVGGGVIGDLVGFVASIYLRGISVIQVPTTLLSQVDASIGGKTGINHEKGKNLIGSFHQPCCVLINPLTLKTLPKREMRSGLAEVIKYGMIMNPALFTYIEDHVDTLSSLDYDTMPSVWHHLISRSCQNKAEVVASDEKESGRRMILNFGHTIGHAIESIHGYAKFTHGECVALGMICATHIATQRQLVSTDLLTRLSTLLNTLGFPTSIPYADPSYYFERLFHDKKVLNGRIRFVLPTTIGQVAVFDDISESEINAALSVIMKP